MKDHTRLKVLVLNKDWAPISIFPLHTIIAQNAVVRVLNGTCNVVSSYDIPIATQNLVMNWPSVIVRTQYLKRIQIPTLSAESLWYRDNKKCAYCDTIIHQSKATIDHVIPKSKGGHRVWENVVLSCPECNQEKGNHLPEGRWKPRRKPWRPVYEQLLKIRRQYPITVHHESWVDFIGKWEAPIKVASQ